MELSDARWNGLQGGYRVPYDPRPALRALNGRDAPWSELWQELHHQGDVGVASYAAVPHIVAAYSQFATPDWNAYALVATIELARVAGGGNPPLPEWLTAQYQGALQALASRGISELGSASEPELVRSILSILAISKGHHSASRLILDYTEDELHELLQAQGAV
jgi:hypothetical protein